MNPIEKPFQTYLKRLSEVFRAGDAREESFYGALAQLVEQVAQMLGRSAIQVTTQPRPTEAGNPDFRVWDGRSRIVGYLEAKPPTELHLDRISASPQLQRYRETFPNLILTNFLEFRLYRHGQLVESAQLGLPYALTQLGTTPPVQEAEKTLALFQRFFDFSAPQLETPESLAIELAKRTRFLREVVLDELERERQAGKGHLLGFYEAFSQFLIADLSPQEFADLYAQTITYGLFAARTRATNGFTRQSAYSHIPPTLGILRDLFRFLSLGNLPPQMEWIVDEIAQVLADADVQSMITQFARTGRGDDPVVHFYETFLAHYDPQERERRGVYYTPDPVVSYITRSLHALLKSRFEMPDGLADERVTLLDPSAGTMTFIVRSAERAVQEFTEKYGTGARNAFIRDHILPHFCAFELMMAPYAVGHLKFAFFLEELGYHLHHDERVRFYLTNTLDMSELEASRLPGLASLAEESHLAGQVKRNEPILAIVGNPPYSGHSANQGEWIRQQVETYKYVNGEPLNERNSKWLQDDYVKFLRFAQWKIEQAGRGMVGMITNHSYLDNPTFRGMRWSLLQTFDELYLLNLHGNSLKREKCPDGSPDENVFDIRQGVAIALFIKYGHERKGEPKVFYADLWGRREAKYDWLDTHDVANTDWTPLNPQPPFYLFVPQNQTGLARYNTFPSVTEIFEIYGVGMTTARDNFVIDHNKNALVNRIRLFKHYQGTDEELHTVFQINKKQGWSIRRAWQMLQEIPDSELEQYAVPVLYRPFDIRWIFYHDSVVWRTVKRVMRHMMLGENVALITHRREELALDWSHALVTEFITEHGLISSKTTNYHFPLYLYPKAEQGEQLSLTAVSTRRPNLKPELFGQLAQHYGQPPTPEQVFYYLYAVLYAPTYREQYADYLRIDFPRVPFTQDHALFLELAGLGERLANLHLLRSAELDPPLCRFEGEGDNRVRKVTYKADAQQVWINPQQYFAPVRREVWECLIGGYQVCEKWLKDRRERALSLDEVRTYCKVVTALAQTIELQQAIDMLYQAVEATTIYQV